jgi:hypothetical protein
MDKEPSGTYRWVPVVSKPMKMRVRSIEDLGDMPLTAYVGEYLSCFEGDCRVDEQEDGSVIVTVENEDFAMKVLTSLVRDEYLVDMLS